MPKKILILMLLGASAIGLFLIFKKENIPLKTQIIVKEAVEKCSFTDTKNQLILEFCDLGIIKGYSDGTFRPLAPINRAELVTIVYRYFYDKEEVRDLEKLLKTEKIWSFPDIPPDHWAAPYISLAKKQKLIAGYQNGSFEGHQAANRAESWKIMAEAGALMEPSMKSGLIKAMEMENEAWFDQYYNYGKKIGMKIDNEEIPRWSIMAENISRQEVVRFLAQMSMTISNDPIKPDEPKQNPDLQIGNPGQNSDSQINNPDQEIPINETMAPPNMEPETYRRRGGTENEAPQVISTSNKFATYIQNHGARRPQSYVSQVIANSFTDVYISSYEPEWAAEFIHLMNQFSPQVNVQLIAEGECALAIDPSCGNTNLTIYSDPNRVKQYIQLDLVNAWLSYFGSPREQVRGIHYDVEAYLGPGSFYQCENNGIWGKCTINNYLQMLTQALGPLKTEGYKQSIVWGSSRNTTPDTSSDYTTDLGRIFNSEAFKNNVDEMLILAYHDQNSVSDVEETFTAAQTACGLGNCPKILPVIETDHVPGEPVATFYEEGKEAAEQMIISHQQTNGQHPAFAGIGVHWLSSFLEPEKVNKSIFPQSIRENERDVTINNILSDSNLLNSATPINFTINITQTAGSGQLKLQISNESRTRIIANKTINTANGINDDYVIQITETDLTGQTAGNYRVDIYLESNSHFDRKNSTFNYQIFQSPPPEPSLSLPVIIGFSSPIDVLNPGDNVRTLIEEQMAKGVKEIPMYMGGNVTPDGRGLSLAGVSPDLQNFMNLLDDVEATHLFTPNTLRIRPYIRASLTQADLDANLNSPGKVPLSDLNVRNNLKILINQIANGQIYNIDGNRIDEITLDLEDITASNYDEGDVAEGDLLADSSITTINNFILELKQSGFSKKIGLYSLGILNQNWFPSTSYFTESPRNFISVNDLSSLFQSGLDVFEFAAYSIFPLSGGAGGLAEQNTFGPIHTNYQDFVVFHIQTIQSLGKNAAQNLRIILPVYTDASVINLSEGISFLQNLISSNMISKINGGVFDFGSLEDGEKTAILNAQD